MGLYKAGEKGLSVRQLADQMGVNKKGIKKLEDALAEMKQHNDIAYKKGNCWIKHPETYFKAEVSRVSQRSGFVKQVGDMPQEYFVRGRDMCGAIPGDIVLAKMTAPSDDIHHSPEAVVLAVLEETDALLTGVIVAEGNKLMVLPDRLCSDPLVIAKVSKAAAMHVGDKVVFSIKKRGERHMDHTVNIVDVFGSSDTAKAGCM